MCKFELSLTSASEEDDGEPLQTMEVDDDPTNPPSQTFGMGAALLNIPDPERPPPYLEERSKRLRQTRGAGEFYTDTPAKKQRTSPPQSFSTPPSIRPPRTPGTKSPAPTSPFDFHKYQTRTPVPVPKKRRGKFIFLYL